jgi:hypothetical protein
MLHGELSDGRQASSPSGFKRVPHEREERITPARVRVRFGATAIDWREHNATRVLLE